MNQQVTDYIQNAPVEQAGIMKQIRELIHESVPGVTEEFKWSRPVFRSGRDFAYFKVAKTYLTLGFFNFEKLPDPHNKLEGSGKDMRHIKLKSSADIDTQLLGSWFRIASQ